MSIKPLSNPSPSRWDQLTPEQRAQVSSRLSAPKPESSVVIPRQTGNGNSVPLSFAQQRLWFLDRLVPNNALYNLFNATPFDFLVDVKALEQALGQIVTRHEVLRTRFAIVNELPVQIIEPLPETTQTGRSLPRVSVPIVDLRGLPSEQRQAEAQRLTNEEAQAPFDLQRGPLLRCRLLRLEDARFLFLLTIHHIVADGWSMNVFFRELHALYGSAPGLATGLPELPIQYADFAIWQRQWLQGPELQRQLDYWRAQLKDLQALELPTERARPSLHRHQGAFLNLELSAALTSDLQALSRQAGTTLFMTLLAGFKALLQRYCDQNDIAVGSPIAGRNRSEIEGLIGFFVNTLVLRTSLSDDPSFSDLLQRVHTTALGAYSHQDLPFEMLVETLQPERDLSRNPLFQVMFQLLNLPDVTDISTESAVQLPVELTGTTAKFDLTLSLAESGGRLQAWLEYNSDLFSCASAERLLEHYRQLLQCAVADPQRRLSELTLIDTTEQQRLLVTLNDTDRDYPRSIPLASLFEARVAQHPQQLAVVWGEQSLTYAELDQRANCLAQRLLAMGLQRNTVAGVLLERSPDMIIANLALLKAGGAYLPLDPSYPASHVHMLLDDAGVVLVLTTQALSKTVREFDAVQVVLLDANDEPHLEVIDPQPLPVGHAEQIAYVMYTSGSTGRPKGVAVPQRAVARLVCNTSYLSIEQGDRVSQMSNCSFDAATFEIWGTLLNGATLVGIDRSVSVAPQELATVIDEQRLTHLFLTTAMFNQVARQIPWAFKRLKHLLFGGEKADAAMVRTVLAADPPGHILHLYGPTESTTFASVWSVDPHSSDLKQHSTCVPIGLPVDNTRLHVLDPAFQPLPIGVPGELYIGGDGLAHGYLGRPGLTAAFFVPDPHGILYGDPGARLYRTGDRVRRLADGEIEFLGRLDHQVKLRGFRIEPGEIEAALLGSADVAEALVMVREDTQGDHRLVAYVVPNRSALTVEELRTSLREQLPTHMVPSAFVLLNAMPLTANGKIDRHALARPTVTTGSSGNTPLVGLEQTIARLWQEVLDTEQPPGRNDNFFDLGGHSLLLARVHERLKVQLQRDIAMLELFRYPSIASLAHYLSQVTDDVNSATRPTDSAPPESAVTRAVARAARQTRARGRRHTTPHR